MRRRCGVGAAVALALVCLRAPLPAQEAAPMRTEVVLLGTGTPNDDPERWGPSVAETLGDRVYLVAAGVGVVHRSTMLTGCSTCRCQFTPNTSSAMNIRCMPAATAPEIIFSCELAWVA